MSTYIVKESCAPSKSSWKWQYKRVRVAVLEVLDGVKHVRMISERARGVIRIVRTWECCYDGPSDYCQAAVARREAEELTNRLNDAAYQVRMLAKKYEDEDSQKEAKS